MNTTKFPPGTRVRFVAYSGWRYQQDYGVIGTVIVDDRDCLADLATQYNWVDWDTQPKGLPRRGASYYLADLELAVPLSPFLASVYSYLERERTA